MKKLDNQGIILIEAILALGVIIVVMTALITALITSLSSSNFSKDQTLSTGYAQEGIEITRNYKESSYSSFSALNGTYCISENQTTIDPAFTSCSKNVAGKFTRTVYVSQNGIDYRSGTSVDKCQDTQGAAFVASVVRWTDSKCSGGAECHRVELSSCFVNLYRINL